MYILKQQETLYSCCVYISEDQIRFKISDINQIALFSVHVNVICGYLNWNEFITTLVSITVSGVCQYVCVCQCCLNFHLNY